MKKLLILFITVLLLSGCSTVISDNKTASDGEAANYNMSFTESETDSSYSINGSTYVTLGDDDLNIRKGGT